MSQYFTIILNSIAAAIQGWDQTGSNGANLSWPTVLGIPNGPTAFCNNNVALCAKNNWLVGLVNSMPYFCIFLLFVTPAVIERAYTDLLAAPAGFPIL